MRQRPLVLSIVLFGSDYVSPSHQGPTKHLPPFFPWKSLQVSQNIVGIEDVVIVQEEEHVGSTWNEQIIFDFRYYVFWRVRNTSAILITT